MYFHGPADDTCAFHATGCFCFVDDRLLLIRRQVGKPLAFHWGIPTGKLERGETPRQAIIRELAEEVGLHIPPEAPHEVVTAIVEDRTTRFAYTTFELTLPVVPNLHANATEVDAIAWPTIEDLTSHPLVPFFYNTLNDVLEWRRTGRLRIINTPQPEAHGLIAPR